MRVPNLSPRQRGGESWSCTKLCPKLLFAKNSKRTPKATLGASSSHLRLSSSQISILCLICNFKKPFSRSVNLMKLQGACRALIVSPMYCQACCNLNPQTALNDPKLSVFLDEVEAQKQRGCRFCTLLCGIVETFMPDWQKAFVALGLSVEAYEGKPIKARLDGIKSFKHVADVEIAGYLQIYSPTGRVPWPDDGDSRHISFFGCPGLSPDKQYANAE